MRYARKVDANHVQVVSWLEQLGASVQPIASSNAGVPDLVCGYLGVDFLVEVKPVTGETRRRELRDTQVAWHSRWKGRQPVVVRTLADVQAVLSSIRASLTRSEVA